MVTEAQGRTMAIPQASAGFFARMFVHVRQFFCGLHGHDTLLHFGQGRLSLQCVSCGHETPGWDVKGDSTRTMIQKPRVVQMRLVRQRRVA